MNQTVVLKQHFTQSGEKNGKTWTRHDFKDAGGNKYQTFDDGLASKADSLLNTLVEVEYESESRGQYTNNNLKGIAPVASFGDPVEDGPAILQIKTEDPRRSKEEMRRTDAIVGASALITKFPEEERTIQKLIALADGVVLYFEAGSSAFTQQEQAEESLKF